MQSTKNSDIKSVEGKHVKTSVSLLQINFHSFSKLANEKKLSASAAMDEAVADWVAKYRNMGEIDRLLQETDNYIFARDLTKVAAIIDKPKAANFSAYQLSYLYRKLKDEKDRTRTFEALGLTDALRAFQEVDRILQKATIVNADGTFKAYNEYTIANELKAVQTPVQIEYLESKIGADALIKLKTQRPNVFPKVLSLSEEDTIAIAAQSGNSEPVEIDESTPESAESVPLFA